MCFKRCGVAGGEQVPLALLGWYNKAQKFMYGATKVILRGGFSKQTQGSLISLRSTVDLLGGVVA